MKTKTGFELVAQAADFSAVSDQSLAVKMCPIIKNLAKKPLTLVICV